MADATAIQAMAPMPQALIRLTVFRLALIAVKASTRVCASSRLHHGKGAAGRAGPPGHQSLRSSSLSHRPTVFDHRELFSASSAVHIGDDVVMRAFALQKKLSLGYWLLPEPRWTRPSLQESRSEPGVAVDKIPVVHTTSGVAASVELTIWPAHRAAHHLTAIGKRLDPACRSRDHRDP
jgi:hypothetical protein